MFNKKIVGIIIVLILSGCATKLGGGGSAISGSGGAAGAKNQAPQLIHCVRPIGTAALLEPETNYFSAYGLSSPIPLVRLMMTQSGCFKVVNRGAASKALQKERALAAGGQLRKGSSMGGGQMVAADYIITPNIVNKNGNSNGGGVGLGVLGGSFGLVGALLGGVSFKKSEAQVMLSVTNVRTGVDEAIAEGSASKTDLGFLGGGFAGGLGAIGGGYGNTNMGKVVTAAFLDAHNKLVVQLGGIPVSATKSSGGYITSATVNFRSGSNSKAPILGKLYKGVAITPTGKKRGNWWEVEAIGKTGWVHSDYITR